MDFHWRIQRGVSQGRTPPLGQISFIFMQFSAQIQGIHHQLAEGMFLCQEQLVFDAVFCCHCYQQSILLSKMHFYERTRKHSSRLRTDRTITRSDRVASKDEQWPSSHEEDCEQNHRRVWKHYLHLRSVINHDLHSKLEQRWLIISTRMLKKVRYPLTLMQSLRAHSSEWTGPCSTFA